MAYIIDGKAVSSKVRDELKYEVDRLAENGRTVSLAVLLVGNDPASERYVRNKEKDCAEVGIRSITVRLDESATTEQVIAEVGRLNSDDNVDGVIVQLPLPKQVDKYAVVDAISPEKDVDCFTPVNVGLLMAGRARFAPCTPFAVVRLLREYGIDPKGKRCVIIGRSDIVGKPLALLLTALDATVTVCHSKTFNIAELCRDADILISAVGKPHMVTADMVKPGATVIDVGINSVDGVLCGDVDYDSVVSLAGAITPVPGGVGPVTRAMLLANVVESAKKRLTK